MQTVLVVEDNIDLRTLYAGELKNEGYAVLCAGNGRESLDIMKDQHTDIVVLDINLPDMDGLEVLERLLESQPQLPVVINSAHAAYQDSFLSWAASAYVVKSGDLSELKLQIATALAKNEVGVSSA